MTIYSSQGVNINMGIVSLQLLKDLEAAMYSHQVKVASPLEMAPSGKYKGQSIYIAIEIRSENSSLAT